MTTEESIISTSTASSSSSSSIQRPLVTHPLFDICAFNNKQFDFLINHLKTNIAQELCRIAAQLSYGSVFNNRIERLSVPIRPAKATVESLLNLYIQAVNADIQALDLLNQLINPPLVMPHEIAQTIVDICQSTPYLKTFFISKSGLTLSFPQFNEKKKRHHLITLMESSLIRAAIDRTISFFSNPALYLPAIEKFINDFMSCRISKDGTNYPQLSIDKKILVEDMLKRCRIEIDVETINRASFMESEPLVDCNEQTMLTGKMIINKKWIDEMMTAQDNQIPAHNFVAFGKMLHECGHIFTPFVMFRLGFDADPVKNTFVTPTEIGTHVKNSCIKGDAGFALEQRVLGGRLFTMNKSKRRTFNIRAVTISDEPPLGMNIQHYYLIRNHRVNQYTDTFIQNCPTLDQFRIESTSADRYGLATPQKLYEMLKEENNNESPLNSSSSSVSSSSVTTPNSSPLQQKRRASTALIHMETPCIIYGDDDHRRLSTSSSSSIDSKDDNEIEISCTCFHHDHEM